jgi:hypothetical protein
MHCCYSLARDSGLITLQPADRFSALHRHWTEGVGITLGFVVGPLGEYGYQFDGDEIIRTVDLVLNRTRPQ